MEKGVVAIDCVSRDILHIIFFLNVLLKTIQQPQCKLWTVDNSKQCMAR